MNLSVGSEVKCSWISNLIGSPPCVFTPERLIYKYQSQALFFFFFFFFFSLSFCLCSSYICLCCITIYFCSSFYLGCVVCLLVCFCGRLSKGPVISNFCFADDRICLLLLFCLLFCILFILKLFCLCYFIFSRANGRYFVIFVEFLMSLNQVPLVYNSVCFTVNYCL